MQATRAQMDRIRYMAAVKRDVFAQENLWVRQDMAQSILVDNGRAVGVTTQLGENFRARAVLLTTGTFMRGLLHIGLNNFPGGRMGDPASMGLSASLENIGLELGRLKTGTTPRLLAASIDFSALEEQPAILLPRSSVSAAKPIPCPNCPAT